MMDAVDKRGVVETKYRREKYDPEEPEMLQMAFRAMDSKRRGYISLEVTENMFSDKVKVLSDCEDEEKLLG